VKNTTRRRLKGEHRRRRSDDKTALLRVIGGFLRDVKTKQAYAS
jgi:hypothetical protein